MMPYRYDIDAAILTGHALLDRELTQISSAIRAVLEGFSVDTPVVIVRANDHRLLAR